MNALVTRNRELISRSGSYVRAADGVARGGDPPRHSVFFFLAKSVTFPGVFFIDVIYFQKVPHYDPLCEGAGASSRGTMDSHARVGKEAVDGTCEIVNATGVVD